MNIRIIRLWLGLSLVAAMAAAQDYTIVTDMPYVAADESDPYRVERCNLDIYLPEGPKGYPTVVWFHGGGLTGGDKYIPDELKGKGIAVVAPNYRLSPRAEAPAYVDDAAEAVAWTFRNIEALGGDPSRIYVGGHSAGGYLTLMLALDKDYLAQKGVDADSVAAWFPLSGQTLTHYTVRAERGYPDTAVFVDEMAPLAHLRVVPSPLFLITGDRTMELPDRYQENELLYSRLRNMGDEKVWLYELQGFDHGAMYGPGALFIANYIRR